MKLHRAVFLVLMFLLAALLLFWAVLVGIATASAQSLIALSVVLGGAIIAGAAFSLRRYFPRR
ncbi:MAG TPA: hypothetical protein VF137_07110 [Candidatus Dormibacteraeota bacterium]